MTETIDVIVRKITDEAEAIRSFELVRADGKPLPAFTAGSHVDVHTPSGAVRQYSLLNDERETERYIIGVLRADDGKGGSLSVHTDVKQGDLLRISAPRNAFPLENTEDPVVLCAGGIGVTPLLAMARSLAASGRRFTFHFATRSRVRTPFLQEMMQSSFSGSLKVYHDTGESPEKFDAVEIVRGLQPGTHVYLCGPGGFMDYVYKAVSARSDIVLHQEYFSAVDRPTVADGAFKVRLARTGVEAVIPAGQSILEVLQALDVDCAVNCEQGICGTCLTTVLYGDIEHHDHFLSPRERACGDRMLICVSRGKIGSELVLDI